MAHATSAVDTFKGVTTVKSHTHDFDNNNTNTRSSIACLTYMSRHALQIGTRLKS